jgi:hypothetical protein
MAVKVSSSLVAWSEEWGDAVRWLYVRSSSTLSVPSSSFPIVK